VVKARREIDSSEESRDVALFTAPDEFAQGVIDGVLLGSESADLLGPGEQTIINLEIRWHADTLGHTRGVSRWLPDAGERLGSPMAATLACRISPRKAHGRHSVQRLVSPF
jgi:hypothetical protein